MLNWIESKNFQVKLEYWCLFSTRQMIHLQSRNNNQYSGHVVWKRKWPRNNRTRGCRRFFFFFCRFHHFPSILWSLHVRSIFEKFRFYIRCNCQKNQFCPSVWLTVQKSANFFRGKRKMAIFTIFLQFYGFVFEDQYCRTSGFT